MNLCDLTLPTPAGNLALEEAFLDLAESGRGSPLLRFWEPQQFFVVVGYGNKVAMEVQTSFCERLGIPVFRRSSGGGTVLQGPGCLNYCLILPIASLPELHSISSTNRFVMDRNRNALEEATSRKVEVCGHSDLTIRGLKFSGNAQRRRLNHLMFHGSILLNMDLDLIEQALYMPTMEPDYREGRPHKTFLMNLQLPGETVKKALARAWDATTPQEEIPTGLIGTMVREKFGQPEWNLKF